MEGRQWHRVESYVFGDPFGVLVCSPCTEKNKQTKNSLDAIKCGRFTVACQLAFWKMQEGSSSSCFWGATFTFLFCLLSKTFWKSFSGFHNNHTWSYLTLFPLLGPRLVNVTNASETSTLTVDPAVRASSSSFVQSSMPWLGDSDASKVQSRGPGLSKAFVGQRSNFSVDCSKAGKENSTHNML